MVTDAETAAMIEVAKREAPFAFFKQTGIAVIGTEAPLRPEIEKWLRGRIEWIQAGVDKCPAWFKKNLAAFDPELRVRWDFDKKHWVIERLNPTDHLYHRCGVWEHPLGHRLIEALRQGDMWKTSTAEKIRAAEDRAAKQRELNEKQVREKWLERVDSLSRRQLEDFVEVSRAIEHGESLSFAGPDAEMMNRIWKEKKQRPDVPDTALNPGMKPGIHRRKGDL